MNDRKNDTTIISNEDNDFTRAETTTIDVSKTIKVARMMKPKAQRISELWHAAKSGGGNWAIYDAANEIIAMFGDYAHDFGDAHPYKNAEINAKIAAAAPEILAALKELIPLALSGTAQYVSDEIIRARAAIAKAEGRT